MSVTHTQVASHVCRNQGNMTKYTACSIAHHTSRVFDFAVQVRYANTWIQTDLPNSGPGCREIDARHPRPFPTVWVLHARDRHLNTGVSTTNPRPYPPLTISPTLGKIKEKKVEIAHKDGPWGSFCSASSAHFKRNAVTETFFRYVLRMHVHYGELQWLISLKSAVWDDSKQSLGSLITRPFINLDWLPNTH